MLTVHLEAHGTSSIGRLGQGEERLDVDLSGWSHLRVSSQHPIPRLVSVKQHTCGCVS
jgi:hypothetical protein